MNIPNCPRHGNGVVEWQWVLKPEGRQQTKSKRAGACRPRRTSTNDEEFAVLEAAEGTIRLENE
jgi:hypothetical protein